MSETTTLAISSNSSTLSVRISDTEDLGWSESKGSERCLPRQPFFYVLFPDLTNKILRCELGTSGNRRPARS